ncbi:aspartate/glutamate racemase family protein [Variovorax sp. UMC13]|uniref:aspartate/glutamate racemase family protein n=1 Tax=Variovorax sp. UMC13 TaxID=1862326 RepID=UPI0016000511|nr:amino acid racemase [Variovorax sp. UMC13]MBB1598773.1 aspartate racemase [Variovorax sp. UMC13]
MQMNSRKVGILGGMGPAAGADFIRLFVAACKRELQAGGSAVFDQAFPEHWLVQLPVPDRTEALLDDGPSPLAGMLRGIEGLARHEVVSVAIACNTAHAWHPQLQAACPEVELLHIVHETVRSLADDGVASVGLLATLGTYRLGLYQQALQARGIVCHLPSEAERAQLMRGIVEGVKAGDMALASTLFAEVAARMVERHGCRHLVLACTEIPLALTALDAHPGVRLVDPAQVLAQALAQRAYAAA